MIVTVANVPQADRQKDLPEVPEERVYPVDESLQHALGISDS